MEWMDVAKWWYYNTWNIRKDAKYTSKPPIIGNIW